MFIGVTYPSVFIENASAESEVVPENEIVIDEHWIYMFQNDNHNSLQVTEIIWLNNTGDEIFEDDIYYWMPEGANIIATCCNAEDMLCVIRPDQSHGCFGISQWVSGNVISANPFQIYPPYFTPHLSYYGQVEKIFINGTYQVKTPNGTTNGVRTNDTTNGNQTIGNQTTGNQTTGNQTNGNQTNGDPDGPDINGTVDSHRTSGYLDEIKLSVVIGGSSEKRTPESSENGSVSLTSDNKLIGVSWSNNYDFFYMTAYENIVLTNHESVNYSVNMSIIDLPEGWNGSFFDGSNEITSINLTPMETKELTLLMNIPSYKISLQFEYETTMEVKAGDSNTAVFEKVGLYETKSFVPVIYKLPDDEVSTDEEFVNMFTEYQEDYNRDLVYMVGGAHSPDDVIEITYRWDSSGDSLAPGERTSMPINHMILVIGIMVVILYLITFFIIRKRRAEFDDKADDLDDPGEGGRIESDDGSMELIAKRKKLKIALGKLKNDLEEGVISLSSYKELRKKYKQKISEIDTQLSGEAPVESIDRSGLEKKKKQMMAALKKVESDYEDGSISETTYYELKNRYRAKTIEIMKEMDGE
jgi:hypothetical protein